MMLGVIKKTCREGHFLKTLTTCLNNENRKLLTNEATHKYKKVVGKKSVTWKNKLKYLLAKKIETETTSYP